MNFLTFAIDDHKKKIIHQRNIIVAIVMIIILFPALTNQIKTHMPIQAMIIVDGILVLSIVFLLMSIFKKKFTVTAMYVASVGNAIQFLGGTIDTHLYAILFLSVILISLYQEWKALLINVIILCLGFHFEFRHNVYFENGNQYYLFYVMFFLAVGGLIAHMISSEKIRKQFLHQENALKDSQVQMETLLLSSTLSEEQLQSFNQELNSNLQTTKNISREIVQNFAEITRGVESQTTNINTINTSLKDIGSVIEQVADSSKVVVSASTKTQQIASEYRNEMKKVTTEMEKVSTSIKSTFNLVKELNEKNKNISDILTTLNGLSSQTNLLALNASIEAARAGEAGKGFKVVAEEVKKLAEDSQNSSKKIGLILNEIRNKTTEVSKEASEGLTVVENSKEILLKSESIFAEVANNTKNITQHSNENEEITQNLKQSSNVIIGEMEAIAATSEQINASIEEILSSVENQNRNIDHILTSFEERND